MKPDAGSARKAEKARAAKVILQASVDRKENQPCTSGLPHLPCGVIHYWWPWPAVVICGSIAVWSEQKVMCQALRRRGGGECRRAVHSGLVPHPQTSDCEHYLSKDLGLFGKATCEGICHMMPKPNVFFIHARFSCPQIWEKTFSHDFSISQLLVQNRSLTCRQAWAIFLINWEASVDEQQLASPLESILGPRSQANSLSRGPIDCSTE